MHWHRAHRDELPYTVYPKKYAHGFVVLCFVVMMQSFIMNSHEVFIHIHQGCFAGTGAIVRLPQCQWSKPDGYEKISQCITTTKHSKVKTVCIFLGIYCIFKTSIRHIKLILHLSKKIAHVKFIILPLREKQRFTTIFTNTSGTMKIARYVTSCRYSIFYNWNIIVVSYLLQILWWMQLTMQLAEHNGI